ncbi:8-amino-7-oxononanoate synthase [Pseudoalteromonas sp. S554]|jgi:8-amino-7-oxononanoate synthase|uniref:aminotransferase class I/II-fold pyridoxal phosphate-dependent enzyme n=1 Tax=Pseudoalteromonas sp. S554 TaxID=2066516 RepID=UPI00110D178A|nr:8-amino-7-oxononanoate synthase [Pseudoalteromonas sp. S554]TMS80267.1 8-amino-7-oxononanoate synthase [Pseudoalteromonas sp. S554]|tara:strand:- start:1763 stop:2914 length:1152 start_codon:yes stop_codon:yes gene_type:complete
MPFEFISTHLNERAEQLLLRKRHVVQSATARTIMVNDKTYLNFASNDYLGFGDLTIENENINTLGSHSSALVTGYQLQQQALEQYLCTQLGYQAGLLFNSGFSANSSVIKALFQDKAAAQNSAIFQDKLNHASLIDGALHSNAALIRFNHNDLNHLRSRLEKSKAQNKLIISEGVFSMDGDTAPIKDLLRLAKQHNAWLMIDDAHGFGALGNTGLGSCETLIGNILPDILVITFGKAVASSGACVLGSRAFIDYMLQYNRDYTYSTAMSPLLADNTLVRLKHIKKANTQRVMLNKNIATFKHLAQQHNIAVMESDTAIQPIVLGCAEQTLKAANKLKQQGIWLTAIRPPTVAYNTARLRVTLTAAHTLDDITYLVKHLAEALL